MASVFLLSLFSASSILGLIFLREKLKPRDFASKLPCACATGDTRAIIMESVSLYANVTQTPDKHLTACTYSIMPEITQSTKCVHGQAVFS